MMLTVLTRGVLLVALGAGCSFDPSAGAAPDEPGVVDPVVPPGEDPPEVSNVIHIPDSAEVLDAAGQLNLSGNVTIDTDAAAIVGMALPEDVWFGQSLQENADGPEVTLLYVGSLFVDEAAEVTIRGSHPLVILASGAVTVHGTLDASAALGVAGPGGRAPGAGAGNPGSRRGLYDAGGGGAGYVRPGAAGGRAVDALNNSAAGGPGGEIYFDAGRDILAGGSSGGPISPNPASPNVTCDGQPLAGAGGGAVQIYAAGSLVIGPTGRIHAGGGGGSGGVGCTVDGSLDGSSGAGGGSGGMIVLQAPVIEHHGLLASNGGGGGGAAGVPELGPLVVLPGGPGQDGPLDLGVAAEGGPPGGALLGHGGGAGGHGATDAQPGVDASSLSPGNGGGGGGSVGYLLLLTPGGAVTGPGRYSPTPVFRTY